MNPEQLSTQVITALQAQANEKDAQQSLVFFKANEQVDFYGVKTPAVRKLTSELYAQVRGEWRLREAVKACDLLLNEPKHEARIAGILLLARFHKSYEASLRKQFESWFKVNRCDNWALTDAMSCYVLAPWLAKFPDEMTQVIKWTKAENLWLRRASAVALVPLAKKPDWHATIFAQAERLLDFPEDLMHKAVGWLLRSAGEADAAALRRFLTAHGRQMPRTALRYAIEKFPAEERKEWLAKTR